MSEQPTVSNNPARLIFDQASAEKKLGSRISHKQLIACLTTDEPLAIETAKLTSYAISGDSDELTDAERLTLRNFVAECKANPVFTTDSQRRRLWPRKVAAIIAFSRN